MIEKAQKPTVENVSTRAEALKTKRSSKNTERKRRAVDEQWMFHTEAGACSCKHQTPRRGYSSVQRAETAPRGNIQQ